MKNCDDSTLFVFTDQALGPWVPLASQKRHIIHCHDFLALQSASGQIKEKRTRWSGKVYQQYIKNGFLQGVNFIAVSNNTSKQLQALHPELSIKSQVVYNGLNKDFYRINSQQARTEIEAETGIEVPDGFILHVGGNQWYKNRCGVVEIYDAWRCISKHTLPLLLVGESPCSELSMQIARSSYRNSIHIVSGKGNRFVQAAYSGALALLFPSIAEGFGWPIVEAMACGCPVITTGRAPMTEVGGDVAKYIEPRPIVTQEVPFWAFMAAEIVESIIQLPEEAKELLKSAGQKHAMNFDIDMALNKIESIYLSVN